MGNPLDYIAYIMGDLLKFIYNFLAFHRYGVAIIIFTVIIRLIILPLYIKQYRSTSRMQEIQPQIQEIQKRYKNDKEKLNQELMKVYQDNKVNPAGGCLPLLIQMPILFSLYWVISQPLKFMFDKKVEIITQLFEKIPTTAPERTMNMPDLSIINYYNNNIDKLSEVTGLLSRDELLNMNFFGLNLGLTPTWSVDKIFGNAQYAFLLLIPILAAVTTYISVKFSSTQTTTTNNDMANSMTQSMSIMMPLMTAFFAFSVPAGLGLYWITGNVIQVFQQMFMNKYIIKKKEVAKK